MRMAALSLSAGAAGAAVFWHALKIVAGATRHFGGGRVGLLIAGAAGEPNAGSSSGGGGSKSERSAVNDSDSDGGSSSNELGVLVCAIVFWHASKIAADAARRSLARRPGIMAIFFFRRREFAA